MKKLFLGNNERITTGIDMSDIFLSLAKKDEQAGNILYQQKLYNQAAYFYIQSMEKYIKSFICKKIDITNEFYAKTIRGIGHSLDSSINFMIEIIAGNNKSLKEQLEKQIKEGVFKNLKFEGVYNAIRYPFYRNNKTYTVTYLGDKDCILLREMYQILKKYMNDFEIRT